MRAAIVGCGSIASVHAKSIRKLPGNELVGFADIKEERARAFADEYGGRAYSNLEEMLERERPEVLHICTPHYLHVPMAIYGLEKGCHVFMEKPPAISKEQFAELERACLNAGKNWAFVFRTFIIPA